MNNKSAFEILVNDAKSRIKECSIAHIYDMTKNNKLDGILIDIRELSEYENGYISNAIHISRSILEAKIESIIPNKEEKVYLYCGGGLRSAFSADNLIKMGCESLPPQGGSFDYACKAD